VISDDLRQALTIARDELPPDTHPVYLARLDIIERLIIWTMKQPEYAKHWADVLRREEHKIDVEQQR